MPQPKTGARHLHIDLHIAKNTMKKEPLGKLEELDVHEYWANEAQEFTPWLAREENIALLAEEMGLELIVEKVEQPVGPFRADIVCKTSPEESLVLIENQLAKTDHTHLGQLMTYAAGLDAVTIVWIAERFTDEHRAALDWLNEITGPKMSFFGFKIELWRIGDSAIAPKFNVVCEPNDWTKRGGTGPSTIVVTETKLLQQQYWVAFREFLADRKSVLRPQKASAKHWLTVSIGRTGLYTAASVNTQETRIGTELYVGGADAKNHFARLKRSRTEIEAEMGETLDWLELPEKEACRIVLMRPETSIEDRSKWPEQHAWLADKLEKFNLAFRKRVTALPASYLDDQGAV